MLNTHHASEVMAVLEGRSPSFLANLDPGLRASWTRSVTQHGLEPDHLAEPVVLTHPEFRERLAPVEELSALSTPEVSRLLHRLAGHVQVVMLTDAQGVGVLYRGSAEYMDRCTSLGLIPGSIWTEETQGTCGIGLCLVEQRPLSVVMSEHFATKLSDVTCTVAPIFGAEGRLEGVLNVSAVRGTDRVSQGLLLEFVASSARRIENLYFDRRNIRRRILKLSHHDDFCDSAVEARLALDDSGRIVDATPSARRLLAGTLREGAVSLLGRRFGAVAGISNVERLLQDPRAAIDLQQGRVHVRLAEPPRGAVARASSGVGGHSRIASQDLRGSETGSQRGISLEEIIGSDPAMLETLRVAQRLHARGLPLLLQGESGSGKTQLARALHEAGPLCAGGFVAINCAAIPQELIESELFGYRPGAFTGAAKQGSPGRITAANGGTLFLDEIGDMPLALQGRLLQVLSEGEFVPVGAVEPVRVRFALISASLRNLRSLVREGRFREDLYYRLSGATVSLAPLRDRADRMDLIERSFARAATDAGHEELSLSEGARRALMLHTWPGNLRELQHVAQYAVTVGDAAIVEPHCLPAPLNEPVGDPSVNTTLRQPESRSDMDPAMLADLLERHGWNVKAAAARLGISRATLHRRILEFDLHRPQKKDMDASRAVKPS